MSDQPADDTLVRAARAGDLDAFRQLVQRHQSRLYSLALRLVRDRSEAEDMTQEAFIRVYRGLASFRGDAAFTTWMTRVALNVFNRHLSRLPRRTEPIDARADEGTPPLDLPDTSAGPEAGVAAGQRAFRLRALVAQLPSPFRETVTVFYLEEKSVEEAAKALSVSTGTLKSRLFRAREMLLRRWRETEALPGAAQPAADRPGEGRHPEASRPEVRP